MGLGTEYLEYEQKGMAAYRAPHMHQPHKLKQALRDAHEGRIPPLVAYFSAAPLSRTISQFGADIVLLDWEHSAMSVETMTTWCHEIQFMSGGRSVPVVRLPDQGHAHIGWALDAGASIMVPQVETIEQASKIVAATKFRTTSKHLARSAPPARFFVGVADSPADPSENFWLNQNNQAGIIIQMESVRGAENLDAILEVCGKDIDAIFLGSLDMRIDMGLEKGWGPEQEYLDVVQKLQETCRKHDVAFANPVLGGNWDRVEGRAFGSVGFDLMTLWQDINKITEAKTVFKNRLAASKVNVNGESNLLSSSRSNGVANGVVNGHSNGVATNSLKGVATVEVNKLADGHSNRIPHVESNAFANVGLETFHTVAQPVS